MKSRLLALCVLFVLIVALVPGVMAQDTPICGNLSADDCTVLTTALTNTSAANSGAFTLVSTIDLQSDDPAQAVKVDINADGKFSGASPMSLTDVAAMSADPAATITKITTGLKSFNAELNLTIGLPASASAMTGGQPLVINLLLVNGVGYLDFSKLPTALTAGLAAYNIPNGWAGLDLVDVLTNLGPSLASGMTGSTSSASTDLPKVAAIVAQYLEYTRDGDTFTGDVDLVGLVNDPNFQAMTNMKPTPAQADAIASLKDVTFEVVFTLDGDKVSEIQFMFDVPESTVTALNATNPSPSSSKFFSPGAAGSFTVDLKYSGLGEAQTITAPDGAPVTKFMELMTMISNAQQKVLQGLNGTSTPAQ